LVTGVLSSAVWFHLPISTFGNQLAEGRDEELKSALQKLQSYGDEMTLFWCMTYTLIVVVVIAFPLWRLAREKHKAGYTESYSYEVQSLAFGRTSDFLWMTRQILVVLAPLISSLLFNWLENTP